MIIKLIPIPFKALLGSLLKKLMPIVIIPTLSISAVAAPSDIQIVNKDLVGFKQIHFGMSRQEIEAMGFLCGSKSNICGWTPNVTSMTFLGQELVKSELVTPRVFVTRRGLLSIKVPQIVNEITIKIDLDSDTVSTTLKESLGQSINWGDRDIWFFRNGATLGVYNPPNRPEPQARIFYFSPDQAMSFYKRFHPLISKQPIDPNDF